MRFSDSFFPRQFGVALPDLDSYLGEALSAGGDYADLYFEYMITTAVGIDESLVKSATQGVSAGVGVRVLSGERTGYAYTDDLSPDKIRKAARTAARIAAGPSQVEKVGLDESPRRDLYPVLEPPTEHSLADRVQPLRRADEAARAADPRVFPVH